MANSNSMTNMSWRPRLMIPRCFWQGSPLLQHMTSCSLGSESTMRARQRTQFILSCRITQIRSCVYPRSGNPQNKECMLIVATPRTRANPLLPCTQTLHMNWFMKLLWVHSFAHFKFEDIFLSHQNTQAQADLYPVTPEGQDPHGKSRSALLLLTHPHRGPWVSPRQEKSADLPS